MNNLSSEQSHVLKELVDWVRYVIKPSYVRVFASSDFEGLVVPKPDNYRLVGGYAGTGKTHLIPHLRNEIYKIGRGYTVAFCAFTGKASSVLATRLRDADAVYSADFIGTIHSLVYQPIYKIDKWGKKVISGWKKKLEIPCDMIIIDEASMVNEEIWKDLNSYQVPIVAFGDHGQLPPVGEDFYLMKKPDYILRDIHRQALGNPIIKLSMIVRNNGSIPYGVHDPGVFKIAWRERKSREIFEAIDFNEDVIALCGMNKSRVLINSMIRQKFGFDAPDPYPGERLICLRNNYVTKIMNGQLGTLMWLLPVSDDMYNVTIEMDDFNDMYTGLVHNCCFGVESYGDVVDKADFKKNRERIKGTGFDSIDLFDFGYAISVHRAQGSEWKKVVLFEERSRYWDDDYYRRWLYTGVTRAKEKLFVVA